LSIAIKVENLSKAYQLGEIGTGTISRDLERWFAKVRGKEDPFLTIGEANDRTTKGTSDVVWSLKDINFEIEQGEAVGIIGRNGAGKSTLLKILSRVTSPTIGKITGKGRIASLLEVGTGFHPELTGRENIYLNGAILGMRKREITRKFDAIVDFAGVERYVDTPVKRYSSGMYVRLAFAVAAHLESEILIVDEVLAVGDAEFQKKCIGKMDDVSKSEGRTILFVSHNMTALNSLCTKAIYLKDGGIVKNGIASDVIYFYLSAGADIVTNKKWEPNRLPGDEVVKLIEAELIDNDGNNIDLINFYTGGGIKFIYQIIKDGFKPLPNLHLFNQKGDCVFIGGESSDRVFTEKGVYSTTMLIPPHLLNDGRYIAGLATSTMIPERVHFFEKEALIFDVIEDMTLRTTEYRGSIPGVVRPKLEWKTTKIE
jgi:lipopolysaccharide transport system ATP-binding protein